MCGKASGVPEASKRGVGYRQAAVFAVFHTLRYDTGFPKQATVTVDMGTVGRLQIPRPLIPPTRTRKASSTAQIQRDLRVFSVDFRLISVLLSTRLKFQL